MSRCGQHFTYREAAAAVRADLAADWNDSIEIAPQGYQEAEAHRIPVLDNGLILMLGGLVAYLVVKATSAVSKFSVIGEIDD